jgi:hypothetical protein
MHSGNPKLKAAQKLLDLRVKSMRVRPDRRVIHFRWKWTGKGEKIKHCLTLCYGGTVIAAWPTSDPDYMRALVVTRMMGKLGYPHLSSDQRKVRSMMLRLQAALLAAEDGPRHRSAYRQRVKVDRLLNTLDHRLKLGRYAPKKPKINPEW